MEMICQACGDAYIIYDPLRREMRFANGGELLTRETLILLRKMLNRGRGYREVAGSLLMRSTTRGKLSVDWGYTSMDLSSETSQALRDLLNTLNLSEQEKIFFYEIEQPYGCFSNCAAYGIEMDGVWWPTTEHFYQAEKFPTPHIRAEIRALPSAKQAAVWGRDRRLPQRPDWFEVRDEVMKQAVLRKFETHLSIRQILMETGEKELFEDALGDYYWGIGADGSGENRLGKVLMEVRDILRRRSSSGAM